VKEIRTYFLAVFIDKPQPEHAKIKAAIDRISNGEYEIAHLHRAGAFFLFNTEMPIAQIDGALSGCVLADDRRLLLEVGQGWQTYGLNKAAFWLKNHR
jgi:hypothetical protein